MYLDNLRSSFPFNDRLCLCMFNRPYKHKLWQFQLSSQCYCPTPSVWQAGRLLSFYIGGLMLGCGSELQTSAARVAKLSAAPLR